MTDDRKNIKIPKELFAKLKADKSTYESWPGYLERRCLDDE